MVGTNSLPTLQLPAQKTVVRPLFCILFSLFSLFLGSARLSLLFFYVLRDIPQFGLCVTVKGAKDKLF